MLAIRFARIGKTKQPTYRLTVTEKSRDTFGRQLEILGWYNPRSKVAQFNAERITYWLSKGAQPSPTVHNLLVDQNLIKAKKVRASKSRKKGEQPAAAEAAKPAVEAKAEAPAAAAEAAPVTA